MYIILSPDILAYSYHAHICLILYTLHLIQVGDYIAEFLHVAIPSIVSGVGDSISLVILEEETVSRSNNNKNDNNNRGERTGGTTTIERFVFNFQMNDYIGIKSEDEAKFLEQKQQSYSIDLTDMEDLQQKEELQRQEEMLQRECAMRRDTELAMEAKSQLERSMRECLLRVLTLRKRRRRNGEKAENMSFKLCMHVGEEKKKKQHEMMIDGDSIEKARDTTSCPELMKALQQGEWLIPSESSCLFTSNSNGTNNQQIQNRKGLLRPIKDINVQSCGMQMQIGMEVDPFE